jgi:hypothetical protein
LVSGVNVAGGQGAILVVVLLFVLVAVLVLGWFIAFLISRPRTRTTTSTIRKCPRLPVIVLVVVLRRRFVDCFSHRQSDDEHEHEKEEEDWDVRNIGEGLH